jgi:hypothetical protein
MLFHDPIRTARININKGQPLDLPAGTAFGGTVSASEPNIQEIVNAQRQDTSCGSCHLGEAAGKAGQLLNFASGGEGRGYTDDHGNFIPRRPPQSILTKLRTAPIFPGDALVDALPTLADIFSVGGQRVVTTPARFYHSPPVDALLQTGRLDELDSVGRQAPSMIGFAFNNRLLFGGLGGEVQSIPGSLNPLNDPAGENLTLLLLDAHRMLHFQSAELMNIPAFVKLSGMPFRRKPPGRCQQRHDAPRERPDRSGAGDLPAYGDHLNTPSTAFGRRNGANGKSTARREAFFTPSTNLQGGAGCFSCHSDRCSTQADDPDVAGIGQFVEQNFFNVGIGDHLVQALNAAASHLDPTKLGKDNFPITPRTPGRKRLPTTRTMYSSSAA